MQRKGKICKHPLKRPLGAPRGVSGRVPPEKVELAVSEALRGSQSMFWVGGRMFGPKTSGMDNKRYKRLNFF